MNRKHLLIGLLCAGLIVAMSCNNSGSEKSKETTEATKDNSANNTESILKALALIKTSN